jgi:hypothetical protein
MRLPSESELVVLKYWGIMLGFSFLFFGIPNLIWPSVPDSFLAQNTRNCLTLIFTGVVLIYTFFRPYSGGIILCINAVLIGFVFRFHPIYIAIACVVFMIGVLSIIRGRLSKRKAPEDSEETS